MSKFGAFCRFLQPLAGSLPACPAQLIMPDQNAVQGLRRPGQVNRSGRTRLSAGSPRTANTYLLGTEETGGLLRLFLLLMREEQQKKSGGWFAGYLDGASREVL
jgi:hypothetical protein